MLDRPAIESSSFPQKLEAMRRSGFHVTADSALDARGEFSPGKFTYNPETLTCLDMAHEWRHFGQLRQMMKKGIDLSRKSFGIAQAPAEVGAYGYEQKLWNRLGASPSQDYLDFHTAKMEAFESQMGKFRKLTTQDWGVSWRGIEW